MKLFIGVFIVVGFTTTAVVAKPFSTKEMHGSINVGCEEDGSDSVSYNAPVGMKIISANVRWGDRSNIQSANVSRVKISKDRKEATASGTIRGLNKQSVGIGNFKVDNCPGGGHATLELFGEIRSVRR